MEERRGTKKELAIELYEKGLRVETIADLLHTNESYVANVLIERGYAPGYVDLYTSTGPQNPYARKLAGVLRFKDLAAAEDSVRRLDAFYAEFRRLGDRRGMHQCQVLALVGKNRAEGISKWAEAQVFADWLRDHLEVERDVRRSEGTRAYLSEELDEIAELGLMDGDEAGRRELEEPGEATPPHNAAA